MKRNIYTANYPLVKLTKGELKLAKKLLHHADKGGFLYPMCCYKDTGIQCNWHGLFTADAAMQWRVVADKVMDRLTQNLRSSNSWVGSVKHWECPASTIPTYILLQVRPEDFHFLHSQTDAYRNKLRSYIRHIWLRKLINYNNASLRIYKKPKQKV